MDIIPILVVIGCVYVVKGQLGGDPASDWLDLGLYRGRLVDTRRIGQVIKSTVTTVDSTTTDWLDYGLYDGHVVDTRYFDVGSGSGRSVDRAYIDRGHIDRGHIDRRHIDRGHIDIGHIDRGHIDIGHVDRGYIDRGRIDGAYIDRGRIDRGHIGPGIDRGVGGHLGGYDRRDFSRLRPCPHIACVARAITPRCRYNPVIRRPSGHGHCLGCPIDVCETDPGTWRPRRQVRMRRIRQFLCRRLGICLGPFGRGRGGCTGGFCGGRGGGPCRGGLCDGRGEGGRRGRGRGRRYGRWRGGRGGGLRCRGGSCDGIGRGGRCIGPLCGGVGRGGCSGSRCDGIGRGGCIGALCDGIGRRGCVGGLCRRRRNRD